MVNKVKLLPSLLIFSEIAKRGSFTEAAKHLGMSKSAVSQQLSRLEEVVGAQLLTRNTRGLSMTSVGQQLLGRCEFLQDQVDLALLELSNVQVMPGGVFSISCPHALEVEVVIPALRQLCQEFPAVEPRLIVTDQKLDLVQDKLDVAIYAGELKDSSYRALPLGVMTEIWCATPAYLQLHGVPKDLNDLCRHRWIAANWQKNPLSVYENAQFHTAKKIKLKDFARASTLSSVVEMARQHMGLVLVPEIVGLPLIRDNTFVRILADYSGPQWPFSFIHPFQGEKPQYVNRFHQLVLHYFAKAMVSPQ